MPTQVLSRTQRNDIFALVSDAGLEPADFTWSATGQGDDYAEVLTHRPTGARFRFGHFSEGGWWLTWEPQSVNGQRYENTAHWQLALGIVRAWVRAVAQDHEAPDLWGELAKAQVLAEPEVSPESQKQFAAHELPLLEAALDDIETYIATTQGLGPSEQQFVHRRFSYLLDAAKAGARKIDWINLFAGQLLQLVIQNVIPPNAYHDIVTHSVVILTKVLVWGGIKLLGHSGV